MDYAKRARDLFQVKPCGYKHGNLLFHVPLDSPSVTRFMADEESNVPEFLEFPYLPSWGALAMDSGKNFAEDTPLTAFMANIAILSPILGCHLFKSGNAEGSTLMSEEEIQSRQRKNLTWYYLRFVNNQNTKTWLNIHGAYSVHYQFE